MTDECTILRSARYANTDLVHENEPKNCGQLYFPRANNVVHVCGLLR